MSIFILSGFCATTTSRPTFLIPYFILRGTNHVFAQELDETFSISEFRPFVPDHYERLYFTPPPVPKEIGEVGLMGVAYSDYDIVFDDANRLRQSLTGKLREQPNASLSASFFDFEASSFVQDHSRLIAAVEVLAQKYHDPADREVWRSIASGTTNSVERSFRAKVQTVSVTLTDNTSRLSLDIDDPEWSSEWHRQWNRSKDRRELISAARDWLQKHDAHSVEYPSVLLTVLNSSRDDVSLREMAARWLALCQYNVIYWGRLWLLLNAKNTDLKASFSEDQGLDFLEATSELADRRSVEIWSLVWNRLRRRATSDRLFQLAEVVAPKFSYDPKFIQTVLANAASQPFARGFLVDWLQSSFRGTTAWADIYSRLVRQNHEIDGRIRTIGLDWLREFPNLNSWKTVWDALASKDLDHSTLIQIASDWVQKAYPDIYIWPEVMSDIISAGKASQADLDIAKRWLASREDRRETRSYRRLEELVGEAGPGTIPPRAAIIKMRARLEHELRKRFPRENDSSMLSLSDLVRRIREEDLTDYGLFLEIDELRRIGNSAAHYARDSAFTERDVRVYTSRLDSVINSLNKSG